MLDEKEICIQRLTKLNNYSKVESSGELERDISRYKEASHNIDGPVNFGMLYIVDIPFGI